MEELNIENYNLRETYDIEAKNFVSAGEASSNIKKKLKRLGVNPSKLRNIAIASYEAELNLVIHSNGGQMELLVSPNEVIINIDDIGPGIENIEQAMEEGYSTAPDSIRVMGFGAGMGLANMRNNADDLVIESKLGEGTHIRMKFNI